MCRKHGWVDRIFKSNHSSWYWSGWSLRLPSKHLNPRSFFRRATKFNGNNYQKIQYKNNNQKDFCWNAFTAVHRPHWQSNYVNRIRGFPRLNLIDQALFGGYFFGYHSPRSIRWLAQPYLLGATGWDWGVRTWYRDQWNHYYWRYVIFWLCFFTTHCLFIQWLFVESGI